MSEQRIPIRSDSDIVEARLRGRALAQELGFSATDRTCIATAISEVARNIVQYAQSGEIVITRENANGQPGIRVVAHDDGPGIGDVAQAMQVGYSTGGSLGLGLPGAKRLMDEFEISSERGKGTTVVMKKWR